MKFKIEIKSRWSLDVMLAVEIEAPANTGEGVKLGKAALKAIADGADLRSADLGGADLRSANLRSANLGGADLRSANLGGADLRGADLRSADLRSADLRSANLRSANLGGADLRSANLGGADLRSADLRSANLRSADLRSANLRSANLGGQTEKVSAHIASITRSDGYMFFGFVREDGSLGIVAGCQNRLLASYRKHVAEDYPARCRGNELADETTAILDFLEIRHAALTKTAIKKAA